MMPRGKQKREPIPVHSRTSLLAEMRSYVAMHPDCTFEEMRKGLALPGLSRPWFMVIKGEVQERKPGTAHKESSSMNGTAKGYMRVEILDTVDISSFSPEIKAHYNSHVLPLLKRLRPDGPSIHFALLSDPPAIEIRKVVG